MRIPDNCFNTGFLQFVLQANPARVAALFMFPSSINQATLQFAANANQLILIIPDCSIIFVSAFSITWSIWFCGLVS